MRRIALAVAALALLAPLSAVLADDDAPVTDDLTIVWHAGQRHPVDADLVGFNWRDGGEIVADLAPTTIRMWSVNFSRITSAPGVYDWTLPDAHVDAIRATGATPMIVMIGRPSWANTAGSTGYEQAVEAAVRRYGVERVPHGARPAVFESGNEPEFYPTAHGQWTWEMPIDVAAQARAIARIEAETGAQLTYGGPAALFSDPPVLEAFAAAAEAAGRPADYLSFHSYTNNPFFGPDGAEHTGAAEQLAYDASARNNPAASPSIIGDAVDAAKVVAAANLRLDGTWPEVWVSEWNLSAGGLDHRNDTAQGAAHTVAALVELHEHGAGASQFFAATDRHCGKPADGGPHPLCGDWGTATADGQRKPTWFAFDLWQRMQGETLSVQGGTSGVAASVSGVQSGLWSLATNDGETIRLLLSNYSATTAVDRRVRVSTPANALDQLTVYTIDGSLTDRPAAAVQSADDAVDVPANSVVLVEMPFRPNR